MMESTIIILAWIGLVAVAVLAAATLIVKLLGNINSYVVKPFKSPPMKVKDEIQVLDGEEGT